MTGGTLILRVITCVLLGCMTMRVTGSAIPMWEFLSRDEKVSNDVSDSFAQTARAIRRSIARRIRHFQNKPEFLSSIIIQLLLFAFNYYYFDLLSKKRLL